MTGVTYSVHAQC